MRRCCIFNLLFLLAVVYSVQGQNLVPNPSFEILTSCPTNIGQLGNSQNWINPTQGTPDCFNICSVTNFSVAHVPDNGFGYQQAHTGQSYAGFYTGGKCLSPAGAREYVQVGLSGALTSGKKYWICFFVSLSNFSGYATSKIGAYLSNSAPLRNDAYPIAVTPQVENNSGIISDTLNWVQISGYYNAIGGEQYITIGNFYNELNTDTLKVGNGFSCHYYYIDDVTVMDSALVGVYSFEHKTSQVIIYPNPASSLLNVETKTQGGLISIFDILGTELINQRIENKKQIDISQLPAGIYLLRLESEGKTASTRFIKE